MRLGSIQALVVLGALVTYLGFVWRGATRTWPIFVPAGVAFVLSIGRGPLPVFLLLFVTATVVVGIAALRGIVSRTALVLMAASDLSLAVALSVFQRESTRWTLPGAGDWEAGSFIVAGAAALRLALPSTEDGDEGLSIVSLGWWQGNFLAVWAGGPARIPLLAASALLLLLTVRRRDLNSAGMSLGGLLAALAGGLGLHPLVALSAGAAGSAFALGERVISVLTLAVLPFSVSWQQTPAQIGFSGGAVSILVPVAIAAVVWILPRRGSFGGRVSAGVAAGSALWLGFRSPELGPWMLYGIALAVAITLFCTRPEDVPIGAVAPAQGTPRTRQLQERLGAAAIVVAYGAGVVTAVLTIRMIAIGFGTGFL